MYSSADRESEALEDVMFRWSRPHAAHVLVLVSVLSLASASVAACGRSGPVDPPATNGKEAGPAPASVDPSVEHPEWGQAVPLTEESLTAAVSAYLNAEASRQGGTFAIDDPEQKQRLSLTPTTVHREGTRKMEDGRYFACADFKGQDGRTYDLDVTMRANANGLLADEVWIHKQDGTPRYNWVERHGVWTREPATKP